MKSIGFITATIVTTQFLYNLYIPMSRAIAANDLFTQLETLSVGDEFTDDLRKLGKKINNPQSVPSGVSAYTFESSNYSHPHFLNEENGKIIFMQLAIPADEFKKYNTILASLGSPETTFDIAHSETLYAFPSKGSAYIVSSATKQVLRVQKFPVKQVYEFENNEGKNFKPKDYLPTLPPPYNPSSSYKNAWSIGGMKQRAYPLFSWLPKPLQYFLFLTIIAVIIGTVVIFIRRLQRTKQNTHSPPELPPVPPDSK